MMDRNLGAASAMPASKTEAEVIKTYGSFTSLVVKTRSPVRV